MDANNGRLTEVAGEGPDQRLRVVLVEDDGRGPSESPSAGLGSRMFDTLGEWTLGRRESRTVLRIHLNS